MKTQKNKLLLSAISLFLCFAMLIGTTFAWFTDSVTSEGNIIQTGNLKIGMQWSNTLLPADSTEWNDVNGAIFTYNNWEPGYTDVKYVKITNNGNLNLKWKLNIKAEAQVSALADIIDVYYVNPVTVSISSLDGLTSAGKLTKVLEEKVNSTGALTPEQSTILAIAFHMPEDAGNEYQNLSLCDGGFSINLIATQETGESDSFGDDYDIGADWGEDTVNFAASSAISASDLTYGALTSKVVLGTSDGISATIPAGVKVADGATNLALSVKAVETDSNITVGEGQDARSLDVHIEGVSPDNTVPMTVNLGAIFKPGLDETEIKIYHTENGTPVLMTRVASTSDFARHNQYTYDPATGEVSIHVATFSVFSVLQTEADTWDGQSAAAGFASGTGTKDDPFIIKTAAQLVYFRNQVDAGVSYKDQYVKLDADIDLDKHLFDPIGFGYTYGKNSTTAFMGTFDGGNHTIYNLKQNGWDLDPKPGVYDTYTYSTAGGGLFASIENATIQNLVMSGADIVFECVDIGIVVGYAQGNCHFENIVVTDSKIANYNRATGGVVGEVCYGSYGTDTNKGISHTFKNIVVDTSVTVSSLWGSFDTLCGGVIGGKWGDATVKMENVISACTLDVFSDCTAAYQWFAYRRCGMLIGHTEQNSPKQALNAAAEFLVCENVDVYYGDWVNYHYYQFTNQTDAAGNSLWYNNYPWVRAEAGLNNGAFSNPRYGVPVVNGVKVTENNRVEELKTDYTPIVFGQLYGGGQGVYGCNEHDGVSIHNQFDPSNSKTIRVVNHNGSTNLKLQYWFAKGNSTWTTNIDGIDMSHMALTSSTYEIVLPAYADGFKILANGVEIGTFTLSQLNSGTQYNIDGSVHSHDFTGDGVCACGETCKHAGGTATCMSPAKCSVCGLTYGGTSANHVDNVNNLNWTTDSSTHKKVCSCGTVLASASHSGGQATCTEAGKCSTCGTPYINALGHTINPASIKDEYYCYMICTRCYAEYTKTYYEASKSHSWTNGECNNCHRKPGYIGSLSDTNIAKGFDTTISFTISNLPKSASNYTVYVMNNTSQTGIQATATGTMSFNVSSLNTGTYSVAVVDNSTEQWVDAKQFNVVDPGVNIIWTASDLNTVATTSGKKSMNGSWIRFTETRTGGSNNPGIENELRITIDTNQAGSSWNGGTMVMKYRKNTWLSAIDILAGNGSAYPETTAWLSDNSNGTSFIFKNYTYNGTMYGLILDLFDHRIAADQYIEIEYIAFVRDASYIG